ncbi:MAG: L,D-transpeptidase [Xanthobacteraceae bacterium]|nr:L,D-transpeptidase [Xanthobacteraceae bacterium]MBX3648976.1 L,D-transpeptidase [Rhodocyclaceae bacterium]MCW5674972.1 L,D-transpeptidase [Xanthobacteraceae bacterium]
MTNAVRHLPLLALIAGFTAITPAQAQNFSLLPNIFEPQERQTLAYAPDDDVIQEEQPYEVPAHLKRQIVNYQTKEAPGTIVVDTANTYLYLVLGDGRAMRYGIGVGRDGFTWSGTQKIAEKKEWPDWRPPSEMIARQPYLPRFVAGGTHNPLGARALYLGSTQYRIHGTNAPQTIGKRVSSGCIRMTNDDVSDLYARVNVGTKVVVLSANQTVRAHNEQRTPRNARMVRLEGPSVIKASELY